MTHYQQIRKIDCAGPELHRSGLFSVPGQIVPHRTGSVRIDVSSCDLGALRVGWVRSSGHDTAVTDPSGITLLVPLSGTVTTAAVDGVERKAGAGQLLFVSQSRRRTRVEPAGAGRFHTIPVMLPRVELREAAMAAGVSPRVLRHMPDFTLAAAAAREEAARALIAAVAELNAGLEAGEARFAGAAARLSWTRLLTERMLGLLALADPAPRSTPRTAMRHARRAMDHIEAYFRDISTVAEIAEICGTGIRSLELAFRDVWGLSPNQALAETRLLAARRRLVLPGPDATVAQIAMECGFAHLGRFPAQYRTRFGELPSVTLKRSRG